MHCSPTKCDSNTELTCFLMPSSKPSRSTSQRGIVFGIPDPFSSDISLIGSGKTFFEDIHSEHEVGVERCTDSFSPDQFILHWCGGANDKALFHNRPFWHIFLGTILGGKRAPRSLAFAGLPDPDEQNFYAARDKCVKMCF